MTFQHRCEILFKLCLEFMCLALGDRGNRAQFETEVRLEGTAYAGLSGPRVCVALVSFVVGCGRSVTDPAKIPADIQGDIRGVLRCSLNIRTSR